MLVNSDLFAIVSACYFLHMNKRRSCLFLVFFLLVSGPMAGCSQSEDIGEVNRVYERVLECVRAGDESALYEMARPEFKVLFEELARRLTRVDEWVRQNADRLDEVEVSSNLLLDKLRFPLDGKDLFKGLVALNDLQMGPSVQAGLSVVDCTIRGEQAVVTTRSGETFGFSRGTEGRWMSNLPERGFELWPQRQEFLNNLELVEKTIEAQAD